MVIHAYVITMAATAATIRSSVAKIGDMAFLDANILLIDIFSYLVFSEKLSVLLFNSYEARICINNKRSV